MWRQLNGVADRVHYPAQDDLAGVPATIPLEQLFEGDGFVAVWFVCRGFGEHAVDHVQQVIAQSIHSFLTALTNLDEVVDEHICLADGTLEVLVGRRAEGHVFRCIRRHCRVEGQQACGGSLIFQAAGQGIFGEVVTLGSGGV